MTRILVWGTGDNDNDDENDGGRMEVVRVRASRGEGTSRCCICLLDICLACCASRRAVAHALPALTAQLRAAGVVPRWLREVLLHRPRHFARAFRRAFDADERAASAGLDGNPAAKWAIQKFWGGASEDGGMGGNAAVNAVPASTAVNAGGRHNVGKSRLSVQTNGKGVQDSSGAVGTGDHGSIHHHHYQNSILPPRHQPPLPPSRYATDFQEMRQLGRGAFGRVVLAVNRLDGRVRHQEVRMATKSGRAVSPAAAARVLREVATLSRLEHAAVVRYNQAWLEEALEEPGWQKKNGGGGRLGFNENDDDDDGSSDEAAAWGATEKAPTPGAVQRLKPAAWGQGLGRGRKHGAGARGGTRRRG